MWASASARESGPPNSVSPSQPPPDTIMTTGPQTMTMVTIITTQTMTIRTRMLTGTHTITATTETRAGTHTITATTAEGRGIAPTARFVTCSREAASGPGSGRVQRRSSTPWQSPKPASMQCRSKTSNSTRWAPPMLWSTSSGPPFAWITWESSGSTPLLFLWDRGGPAPNMASFPSRHLRRWNCFAGSPVGWRTGRPPTLSPIASGWGAGERELADRPNLLRIILAEVADPPPAPAHGGGDLEHDEMIVLEANVDDMNPEWFEPASEALFEAGARDVSLSPLVMKKGRPGTLLRVIASPDEESRLTQTILRETSTIGVRSHRVVRAILPRRSVTVPTRYGNIPVKVVALPGGGERRTPEYADCRRAARTHGVPISRVYEEVLVRASTLQKEDEADSRLAGPGGRGTPGSGL
jgi:hypothetical protein